MKVCFACCVEVAFFSLVAGMSVVSGFATTLMLAKRRDSEMFDKVMKCNLYYLVLICIFTVECADAFG